MSKDGYEQIPDVESGPPAPPPSYDDLGEDQANLMAKMDDAIGMANLDFQMPEVSADELASKGANMFESMVQPTLTSVATAALGFTANYMSQYNMLAELAVKAFPFVNAVIVFASSIQPLSKRCNDAVEPVLTKSYKVQDDVQEQVEGITVKVDTTIDDIQEKVRETLEPLKPVLATANAKAAPLKKIDPELEIPDTQDIDEEFDELQGKVGAKVDEAKAHLDVSKYIPSPLQRPPENFFRKVILPILITALLLQLLVAWVTSYMTMPHGEPPSAVSSTRYLRGTPPRHHRFLQVDIPTSPVPEAQKAASDARDQADAAASAAAAQASDSINAAKDQAGAAAEAAQEQAAAAANDLQNQSKEQLENAHNAFESFKEGAGEKVDAAKEKAAEEFESVKQGFATAEGKVAEEWETSKEKAIEFASASKAKAQEEMDHMKEEFENAKANYEGQSEYYKQQGRSILISVATSYAMSLLQMLLLFLFTSPKVKAWVMKQFMKKVDDEVDRTLRSYGVSTALEDVFGTRMGRIRAKLLKLFKTVGKIKGLLDKIPDISKIPGLNKVPGLEKGIDDAQDKVENAMKSVTEKRGSFIGGLFGRK